MSLPFLRDFEHQVPYRGVKKKRNKQACFFIDSFIQYTVDGAAGEAGHHAQRRVVTPPEPKRDPAITLHHNTKATVVLEVIQSVISAIGILFVKVGTFNFLQKYVTSYNLYI